MFSPADVLMAGEVLTPGQDGYEEAAAAAFAVGTPDLIVRPRDASGVAVAVRYAVGAGLPVSVRSGGHSPAGHSTSDGGVVIDLRHLREVRVLDPGTRRVRVGAGATWGAVAATLQRFGLALTSGDTASVGVGGLTLAGGIGWLVRRYGLAIDAVTGADLVTADGRLVRADSAGHQDLLWALRGGGGNFGVVTSLDFTAQPVASVHFGPVVYRLDAQAGRSEKDETNGLACLITGWHDLMGAADENLTTALALVPPGMGRPAMAVLRCCYASADQAAATAALAPFRRLAPVAADEIRVVPYAAVLEETAMPPGTRAELRNAFFRALDHDQAGAIAGLFRAGATVELRSLGGAFGRVPAAATAFAHRDARVLLVAAVMPPAGALPAGTASTGTASTGTAPEQVARALAGWPAVAAGASGAYTGFLGPAAEAGADADAEADAEAEADVDAGVAAAYPPATYQRLARVKQSYDPGNVFRRNHNIRPAGVASASALPHVLNPASQTGVLLRLNWRQRENRGAMRTILIVGGGYAGFYTAWRLEKKLRRGEARVVVIDPRPYMTYQPFLPEVLAGSVEPRHAAVSLRRHLRRTRLVAGTVTAVDHAHRTVTVQPAEGQEFTLGYDIIVVTAGAVTRRLAVPGVAEQAIGLKHVEEAVAIRDRLLTAFDRAATLEPGPLRRRLLTVTFAGGGFSGVEGFGELLSLATSLIRVYPELHPAELEFHLVEASDRILPEVSGGPGRWVVRSLEKRGARVHLNAQVLSARDGHVVLSTGEEFDSGLLVWTVGNDANPMVRSHTDLPIDGRGLLVVRADLRVGTDREPVPGAWGAGDDAAVPDLAVGRAGAVTVPNAQHAVRQGKLLARNIVATLRGREAKPYVHHSLGAVATLGLGRGIFQYRRIVITGFPAWLMHRGYHVLAVPTWERKLRVLAVWLTAAVLGRDIVSLAAVQDPRRAFVADGEPAGRPAPPLAAPPLAAPPLAAPRLAAAVR